MVLNKGRTMVWLIEAAILQSQTTSGILSLLLGTAFGRDLGQLEWVNMVGYT